MGALFQGAMMGAFLVFGRIWPRVEGQPILNLDLVWNLVNGAALFGVRVTLIAWVADHLGPGFLPTGFLDNAWLQGALAFLLLDFGRYWLHYAAHRVPALWLFHRVHHCAEVLDASTGLRMHLVDFLMLSALPLFLFSVALDTTAWHPAVLPIVLSIGVFFDAFQHANVKVNTASPLFQAWNLVLNNPLFHSWHHTRDGHLRDGNYGNTLVIWDRLFGTDVTGAQPPELFGITEGEALQNNPLSWQLLRTRRASLPVASE